jgi:hypothetical protein
MQSTKRKNRPAETPLKTPPGKKARITTPSMGKKPGEKHYIRLQTCIAHSSFPWHRNLNLWCTLQSVMMLRKVTTSMLQPLIHHRSRWRWLAQSLTTLINPLAMPASRAASNFSPLVPEILPTKCDHAFSHMDGLFGLVQDFLLVRRSGNSLQGEAQCS